ncbi:tetratricopeptide repeat protein [Catelliglobosispora koreensis]|uniref:tetratricopeptide repeat protein n=1 Tax=Catelliglobosispora koreensis TaxID=129052 RepID=UPI00036E521C|nr:tetratricopeptide repeat protein [Catelliglobosispora koreensis]
MFSRRCTVVTAAAGFGKSTTVRTRLRGVKVRWADGKNLEEQLKAATPAPGTVLVFDGVRSLAAPEIESVMEHAAALPDDSRLVLIGRTPHSASLAKWRARGLLAELGPVDLALTQPQADALLRGEYGVTDGELVWQLTGGWPALVHLLGQALSQPDRPGSPAAVQTWLTSSDSPVADFLAHEVFDSLDPSALALLTASAYIDVITTGLASDLGFPDAGAAVDTLRRTGLLRPAGQPGHYRIVPLISAYLRSPVTSPSSPFAAVPPLAALAADDPQGSAKAKASAASTVAGGQEAPDSSGVRDMRVRAARWYASNALPVAGVRTYHDAGLLGDAAELVVAQGEQILASGGAPAIIRLAGELKERPARLEMLHAQALYTTGEAPAALRLLKAMDAKDPAVSWRLGSLLYLAGDPRAALSVLEQADGGGTAFDRARLHSWSATVHWLLGNLGDCAGHAEKAMESALDSGEPGPMAAAHVARALHAKLAGDPQGNGEHYERALAFAEQARDTVQVTRIRSNRASRLIDDARFAEALAEVKPAVRLAEEIGHVPMHALALVNEGEALTGLGRLDEALAAFEKSVWLYRRTGSRMVAYPLLGVAGIHRRQGQVTQAITAYSETIEITEAAGDRQGLVPALAGLARVMSGTDPQAALSYAERAVAADPESTVARLAVGWAKLAAGESKAAAEIAAQSAQAARRLQERALLPEALELMGDAADSPSLARKAWREALELWLAAGAVLDADRLAVGLGALPGAPADDRIAGKLAAARLAAAGVDWAPAGAPPYRVSVRTFGRFEVIVKAGEPVTWQSRKARDLLRILIARRGRPVPREELGELLWPEEDPAKVPHRLSVALSTVRGALDPDKRMPADHFIQPGQGSVSLDNVRIDIDLEDFLLAAEHGLRLVREGEHSQARSVLGDAQRLYGGEFLGDEPYDDWAVPAREEARSVYLRVVRTLAELCQDAGETAEAIGYLYQILQLDPYDESAHKTLIDLLSGHGWHGEAQRAQARYREAMGTLS